MPPMPLSAIMSRLQKLNAMAELRVEEYAEPDGLADSLVLITGPRLKATQLRKFFHHIKDLKLEYARDDDQAPFDRARVAVLMPMLAYAVGRGAIPQEFYDVMKLILGGQRCHSRQDFQSAANYLEAVMAYHKYWESKKWREA